ncbi:hypothetical protein B0H13DRAFT_1083600 [Mycena leptocephala]|nr:hypothetical protein B0H13DRAFT_1083600 [Mycena leptocephala]
MTTPSVPEDYRGAARVHAPLLSLGRRMFLSMPARAFGVALTPRPDAEPTLIITSSRAACSIQSSHSLPRALPPPPSYGAASHRVPGLASAPCTLSLAVTPPVEIGDDHDVWRGGSFWRKEERAPECEREAKRCAQAFRAPASSEGKCCLPARQWSEALQESRCGSESLASHAHWEVSRG